MSTDSKTPELKTLTMTFLQLQKWVIHPWTHGTSNLTWFWKDPLALFSSTIFRLKKRPLRVSNLPTKDQRILMDKMHLIHHPHIPSKNCTNYIEYIPQHDLLHYKSIGQLDIRMFKCSLVILSRDHRSSPRHLNDCVVRFISSGFQIGQFIQDLLAHVRHSNNISLETLPRSSKGCWMDDVWGAYTPSLRVQTAPFGRCWYVPCVWQSIYSISSKINKKKWSPKVAKDFHPNDGTNSTWMFNNELFSGLSRCPGTVDMVSKVKQTHSWWTNSK